MASIDDPDVCIDALQRANERIDGHVTVDAYRALGWTPSVSTIIETFGRWNAALEAAGLEPSTTAGRFSRVDCERAIREVAAHDDRDGVLSMPRYDYLRDDSHPAGQTIQRRFGSFAKFRDRVLEKTAGDG